MSQSRPPHESTGPKLHILLADDDQWTVHMVSTVLERRGYSVETACDGEDALKKALARPPDLLITDALMPLLDTDLFTLLDSASHGRLAEAPLRWKSGSAVTVVLASQGYPGEYPLGYEIDGIEDAEREGAIVFHAGTAIRDDRLVTNGGRVLNVTVYESTLGAALERVYRAAAQIRFKGMHYRRDIGARALGNGNEH